MLSRIAGSSFFLLKPLQVLATGFAVFTVLLTGCEAKKEEKQESTVLKAYRLIDAQRDAEAIAILEDSLKKDPDNQEVRSVLASAYAHKAGIRIQSLVSAINQTEKLKFSDDKAVVQKTGSEYSQKINEDILEISSILTKISKFFEVYASIPVIDTVQATYLEHAIFLLNEGKESISPEDALYRAVLEIILAKHILSEELVGEFSSNRPKVGDVCHLELGRINDSLLRMGKLMMDVFNDIGLAQPSRANDMSKLAQDTGEFVSNATIAITSLTVLDNTGIIFLKETAIQNGFGKIIKCGGE